MSFECLFESEYILAEILKQFAHLEQRTHFFKAQT